MSQPFLEVTCSNVKFHHRDLFMETLSGILILRAFTDISFTLFKTGIRLFRYFTNCSAPTVRQLPSASGFINTILDNETKAQASLNKWIATATKGCQWKCFQSKCIPLLKTFERSFSKWDNFMVNSSVPIASSGMRLVERRAYDAYLACARKYIITNGR